ncbi:MAG: hypothetical protein U9P44_00780 [archaeon]|nr:hypothetical protein [archaeon]
MLKYAVILIFGLFFVSFISPVSASLDCTDYCTNSSDLVCYSECNGLNGCLFYDPDTMAVCDRMPYGQIVGYGVDKVVACCEGAPISSDKPYVSYVGLSPLTVDLGDIVDVVVSVRNRNDFEDTFTLSLESESNLKYWSWFSTHRNDPERMSMNVSFKPYEQKYIVFKVLGGSVGCFTGLGNNLNVIATTTFGKSESVYIGLCVNPPSYGGSLFSRNVPGLSNFGFFVLFFISVLIYGRSKTGL